jgi:hypothetical protein
MADRQSNCVVRVFATLFTTLVAPTLVALFTTAIKGGPTPAAAGAVNVSQGAAIENATPAPTPAVTLLPPTAVRTSANRAGGHR